MTWDSAKHFRGYHGRFAAGADRSAENRSVSPNAFRPRTTAAERRRAKEILPSVVREKRALYDQHARGESLSYRERSSLEWASPRKIAEQRAKTGDAIVPRREFVARERSFHGAMTRATPRTAIKKTFTGKPVVVRGEYRELQGTDGYGLESRVRRTFDVKPKKKTARQVMTAKPAYVGRRRAEP